MAEITTCDVEPFRYESTPQPIAEQGASGSQINEQAIENYLSRLLAALCADLTALNEEIAALDARIAALESP